ncbi:hypothetical protein SBF1_910010 [Candidatus Desulfosporosinus infrequens]|uniref:Transposase n=1 Tax=Candidatus Desulfosporosinus infrequens TaxID=2043169 RepID=A0A2U3LWV1_9FIRM|nr:hypothetical protein SBF1_910010 [Candidatus Desulfosporosinus infrequens]
MHTNNYVFCEAFPILQKECYNLDFREKLYLQIELRIIFFVTIQVLNHRLPQI